MRIIVGHVLREDRQSNRYFPDLLIIFFCHSIIRKFQFEISVNFRFYSSTSKQHFLLEKEIIMDQLQHLIIELLPFSLPHEWDSWCSLKNVKLNLTTF
jgi:hypothetical protein